MRTRLKICCISSVEEAHLAIAAGANDLGLVSEMPSGPGVIGAAAIREIVAEVPSGIGTFLLTSRQSGDDIVGQLVHSGANTVQIVHAIKPSEYDVIRRALPELRLVQVVHVEDEASVAFARERAPLVDALLLDSGRPQAAVAELGGTGRTHDWSLSRRIVEQVDRPVYLAGGLRAGNVASAVEGVRPYGVDLCSGVRRDDCLDPDELKRFVAALAQIEANE